MVNADLVDGDQAYATATEVDGIRRTLDSFMREQKEHNDSIKKKFDELLGYLSKCNVKDGVFDVEDEGSNMKGANPSAQPPPNPPFEAPPPITSVYGSTQQGNLVMGQKHVFVPPSASKGHFLFQDLPEWSRRAIGLEYFSGEYAYYDFDLHDCPWDANELAGFCEMAVADQQKYISPPTFQQKQVCHRPHLEGASYQQMHQAPFVRQQTHIYDTQLQFQHRAVAKGPKLQFPEFDGSDSDGWIIKAEKYFEMFGVPNEERVNLAVMYIKGKAEFWWRGTGYNPATLPWHHFCRMVEDRFNVIPTYEVFLDKGEMFQPLHPHMSVIPTYKVIGQFHALKQTDSVAEYIDKFEESMGLVKMNNPSVLEDYFVCSFVSGLKEFIQNHVQCHKPATLTEAYWFAQRLEQANPSIRKFPNFNSVTKPNKPWVKDKEAKDTVDPSIVVLRAAGKCFRCREPWVRGHAKVCKGKQLFSLVVLSDEAGQERVHLVEDNEDLESDIFQYAQGSPQIHTLRVSQHALQGTSSIVSTFALK